MEPPEDRRDPWVARGPAPDVTEARRPRPWPWPACSETEPDAAGPAPPTSTLTLSARWMPRGHGGRAGRGVLGSAYARRRQPRGGGSPLCFAQFPLMHAPALAKPWPNRASGWTCRRRARAGAVCGTTKRGATPPADRTHRGPQQKPPARQRQTRPAPRRRLHRRRRRWALRPPFRQRPRHCPACRRRPSLRAPP